MLEEKSCRAKERAQQESEKLRQKYAAGLGKIGFQLLQGGLALELRFKFEAWREVCRAAAAGRTGDAYRQAMQQAQLRLSAAAQASVSAADEARIEASQAVRDHKKLVERLAAKMISGMSADAAHVTLRLAFGGWRQESRAKYLNAGRAAISFAAAHKGWSFVALIEFFGQWKGLWSSASERMKLAVSNYKRACVAHHFNLWQETTQLGLEPSRASDFQDFPRVHESELQRDLQQRRALELKLVEMQQEMEVLLAELQSKSAPRSPRVGVQSSPEAVLGLGRPAKSPHHFFVSFLIRLMLGFPLGSEVRAECRAWLAYGLGIVMFSTSVGCILAAADYVSAAGQSDGQACSTPIRFWFLVLACSGARFVFRPILCGYLRFRYGGGPVDSGSTLVFPNPSERLVSKAIFAFDLVWLVIGVVCWTADLATASPESCNVVHPEEFGAWEAVLLTLLLHCCCCSLSFGLVHRVFASDWADRVRKGAAVHPVQQPV